MPSKELVVSSSVHETKVAVLENDEVVEVYFEREQEYSLAGSIYKGRVTRVLPGMQSAFVDVGLERDAFLYVSDFFEDNEEYDKLVTAAEEKLVVEPEVAAPPAPPEAPAEAVSEPAEAPRPADAAPARPEHRDRDRDRDRDHDRRGRGRHRRRRGRDRGFPESKFASAQPAEPATAATTEERLPSIVPVVLPGESLAKYREVAPSPPAPEETMEEQYTGAGRAEDFAVERGPEDAAEPVGAFLDLPSHPTWAAEPSEPPPDVLEPGGTDDGLPVPAEPGLASEDFSEIGGADFSSPEQAAEAPATGSEPRQELAEPGLSVEEEASATVREPAPAQPLSRPLSRRMRRRMRMQQREERRASPPPPARVTGGVTPRHGRGEPLIADLLKEGQEIIVQIAKEPIGKKGARITSHIALPGRYLVYMPTVDHVGVSRRIGSDEERQRLKRTLTDYRRAMNMPGGFIVRTAAESRSDDDLREDMRFLFNLWREIRGQAEKTPAPALLHRDLNLVERILRDQVSERFTTIWVDNEAEYEKILAFVQLSQPSLVNRVKLYLKETPIFEEFGVQEQINNSLKSKVWLKSGGYIVINQTEALVAIDVNTGKYVGKTQRLEDTIVKTNVDAIKEIVRQIRLRDLGGIIVIDFIDMDERRNRHKVMQALEEALRQDRAPSKALAFNDFGLVAITRKRVKQPLEKALGCVCPYCTGSGFVKSPQTVSLEILTDAKKQIAENTLERPNITLRVGPDVARYLKLPTVTIVREIEEMARKPVVIKSDVNLHQENFDLH